MKILILCSVLALTACGGSTPSSASETGVGGSVGVGTVVYALAIGPLAHLTLPLFRLRDVPSAPRTRCA